MGGEGAQWVGPAPFVGDRHMFQNMGDGTFFHSGQLAIQYAVVGRRHDHVQDPLQRRGCDDRRARTPPACAGARRRRELLAEGVKRVIVTTDDPRQVRGSASPAASTDGTATDRRCPGAAPRDRRRHGAHPRSAMRRREAPGAQARSSEAGHLPGHDRRARVRGLRRLRRQVELLVAPADRHRVRPQDVVDQASCNIDASCLKGDCPAFVTVAPTASPADRRRRRTARSIRHSLPDPARLPA